MFLRRILNGGRGLMAMARVKETTGIVGLEVVPNAREVLIDLYTRTLKEIKAVPEDEGYRKAVESFTNHRLQVCREEEDWEAIEKRLGCGQVEELIEEARDELTLIGKMIEWDPWGVPDDYECEVIEDDTPIPKHVPQHRRVELPEEFFKTLEAISQESDPKIGSSPQSKAYVCVRLIFLNFISLSFTLVSELCSPRVNQVTLMTIMILWCPSFVLLHCSEE